MANLYDYQGNFINTGGGSVEIIDNLSTPNPNAALAANQGVVVKNILGVSPIPSSLTKRDYVGKNIPISNNHKFAFKFLQVMPFPTGMEQNVQTQGAACYGDFLFYFSKHDTGASGYCHIYDLRNRTYLQSLVGGEDYGFGDFNKVHCNTVNFGHDFYDANDPFPLLYVSTGYPTTLNGVGTTGALVYRVTTTVNNGVTTYGLQLVQQIKIPNTTTWSEFIIGENKMCYVIVTDNNVSKLHSFRIPELSDGDDVSIDINSPLEVYNYPLYITGDVTDTDAYGQGCFYSNGAILSVSGLATFPYFVARDLATCTRTMVSLKVKADGDSNVFAYEPEAVFIWDGKLCISVNGTTRIYQLFFE